jgi:hypothetical protein
VLSVSLIRLMSYSLVRAVDEELSTREEELKNYLKETQGIDVDYKIYTRGDHGVLDAIQQMKVDDHIRQLTDAQSILDGVQQRLEVMQRCFVTKMRSG